MALVIVLGLISLLLISSVTFAIMMRIERASSANARNTIMARQATRSALTYAVAAINQNVGDSQWPQWRDENDASSPVWKYVTEPTFPFAHGNANSGDSRPIHFWKDTFGSVDHNIWGEGEDGWGKGEYPSRRAPARLMGSQLQQYLPYGIRHRAYAQRYRNGTSGQILPDDSHDCDIVAPEWVPMTAGTNAVNMGNIVGRCAFLAFNTSGYLDIPALCKEGNSPVRAYGASASEIKVVEPFFAKGYGNGNPSDKFKDENKGLNFESVAEIVKLKANQFSGNKNTLNGTVFANGAAYSAFNFSPVGRMPTNDIPSSIYNDLYGGSDPFPFVNKICIGGDGSDDHIESLRRHKAAIIAAFYLSGLTQSSDAGSFDMTISDKPCTDNKCTVCGGTAPKFTLNKDLFSEQALWAYLNLIDYADEDNEPEGADDFEKFARPTIENTPFLNGFMATIRLSRDDLEKEEDIPDGYDNDGNPKYKTVKVFDGEHALYSVEFNGKVVFANRNAALVGTETKDDEIDGREVNAKIGFRLDGADFWQDFLLTEAAKLQFEKDYGDVEFDTNSGADGVIFTTKDKSFVFGDGPICFIPTKSTCVMSNVVDLIGGTIEDPTDEDDYNSGFGDDFPEQIHVGAAAQVFDQHSGDEIHRVPAYEGVYEDPNPLPWLSSSLNSEYEGFSFKEGHCYEEEIGETYSTTNRAISGGEKDYKLKRKSVNLVLWADMVDPAFSCYTSAETLYNYDVIYSDILRIAIPSHHAEIADEGDNEWRTVCSAHPSGPLNGFGGASDLIAMLNGNKSQSSPANADFEDFVREFRENPENFAGYFFPNAQGEGAGDGDDERIPGYSALQRFLLEDKDAIEKFKGVRDGLRRTALADANDCDVDDFFQQFNSLHCRNGGLDSVGELGFLPIGPYATIRLFGFMDECGDYGINDVDEHISTFNAVPYRNGSRLFNRPFHRVLDFFCATNGPSRGKINLNGGDFLATASAFNDAPLNDFLWDDIADADELLDEDAAKDLFAPALRKAVEKDKSGAKYGEGASTGNLSDIGLIYDDETYYGSFDQDVFEARTAYENSHMAREAAIRNTCGLFTTRGLNFTILLRGEAFTPFFGRSDVRNDMGTTLSSRTALAQIWRDTVPDADGNYPFFVQYFKIFDE